ncbi:hypothetical protein KIPB_011874, partial [Kipferlia bialata]|eukprot:g11874.t1
MVTALAIFGLGVDITIDGNHQYGDWHRYTTYSLPIQQTPDIMGGTDMEVVRLLAVSGAALSFIGSLFILASYI